jgi:transcriptional regulator with XRE-family HTH domain
MHAEADGSALLLARTSRRLSREALGARAGGISSSTIRRIERGEVTPRRNTLDALVRALDDARPHSEGT